VGIQEGHRTILASLPVVHSPLKARLSIRNVSILLLCALLSCFSFANRLVAQDRTQAIERTAHYTVVVEGGGVAGRREALVLGVVLESAWKQFAEILQAEPALKSRSEFQVRVLADKQSWSDAVSSNGMILSANLDTLCYIPERDLVLLYRQPTEWFTRRLALHGAWQQFHCRAKSKHADLVNSWIVLGLAEELSQHRLDGSRLELAAHPRITVIDLPRQALEAFNPGEAGLQRFVDEALREPALSWALVSFLREGKDQKYRARFDKLALGQTGSKLTGAEFAASLGKAAQVSLELQAWLRTVQEPLEAACGDWEDVDGRLIIARAPSDDFAFAVVKAAVSEVSARFELQGDTAAGIVLAWTDRHHYAFATVGESGISVQRCAGDELVVLGEYQAPPAVNGSHLMRGRRMDGRVTLFVEDKEIASFELEGDRLGFAVDHGVARFTETAWK